MSYSFKKFQDKIEETKEWLSGEFMSIQTGRATPAVLDNVKVTSYGSQMPINQIASIGAEGPRTLRVTPWDKSQIEAIEKAINDAQIGVSASSDEAGVRISFPELTVEKRETLLKVVGDKTEKARVSIRGARDEVWNDIQNMEKEGEIGEDEKFRLKSEMEEITKEANQKLEELKEKKEKDIKG